MQLRHIIYGYIWENLLEAGWKDKVLRITDTDEGIYRQKYCSPAGATTVYFFIWESIFEEPLSEVSRVKGLGLSGSGSDRSWTFYLGHSCDIFQHVNYSLKT